MAKPVRIQKVLSDRGVLSRRRAEEYIREGRITVNGRRAEIGHPVYPGDVIAVDGVRVPMERTAALNKWKMVGEVLVPGVLEAGAVEKTDGCARAAALADKI